MESVCDVVWGGSGSARDRARFSRCGFGWSSRLLMDFCKSVIQHFPLTSRLLLTGPLRIQHNVESHLSVYTVKPNGTGQRCDLDGLMALV